MSEAIAEVRVETVRLPLPRPLRLGPMQIASREYAAVTVTAADGVSGRAYCLTREAPVAALVERLVTPHLVGRAGEPVEQRWDELQRANLTIARNGLALRALGLVDVALWDIRAQRAGLPLWKLLASGVAGAGDAADGSAPALLVAAYPTPDRTPAEIAAEVVAGAAQGFARVKISRDPDPVRMAELLRLIGAGLPAGSELVVDVGFAWRGAEEALAELAQWGRPSLAWLEDPLPPEDAEGWARLRRESGLPIGGGDEVTDARTYADLLAADALDVMRVDILAFGGVTPSLGLLERARASGVELSFHVYPEISVQLAAAYAPAAWVELFDGGVEGGNPYDPAHRLFARPARLRDGRYVAPELPGLGVEFDRELVR